MALSAVTVIEIVFVPIIIYTVIILLMTCIIFGRMIYFFVFHRKYRKTHTLIRRLTIIMVLSYIISNILDIAIFYIGMNDELNNIQQKTQYEYGTNLKDTILNLRTFEDVEIDGLILNILTSIFSIIGQCSLYLILIGRLFLTFQDTLLSAPTWLFFIYGIAMLFIFLCWIISFVYIIFFGRSNPMSDLQTLMISVSFISFVDFFMGISLIYLFGKKLYILILTRKKTSCIWTNTPTQYKQPLLKELSPSQQLSSPQLQQQQKMTTPSSNIQMIESNDKKYSIIKSKLEVSLINNNNNNDYDDVKGDDDGDILCHSDDDINNDNKEIKLKLSKKKKYFGKYNIYSDSPLVIMMIRHTLLGSFLIVMNELGSWSHALVFGGLYNNTGDDIWYIGWIILIYWNGFSQIFIISCVYLGFGFANKQYQKICKHCDLCCRDVCECITSRMIINTNSLNS